ncbi:putative DNA-binding domain-containing protein [Candidatus Rariloculus sp.]|uniref:HvfC/BufC family peptide modification chaperone n=1 Tax=Candidatus Rariloculus sp. TaxID=3101265 RepID=UPI003D0A24E8
MSTLHRLQLDCERAFRGGDAAPLLPALAGNAIPAATRIEVYRNNAREICRKALANTYPVVEQLVGDACFRSLARKYLDAHPSTSGDLQHFGREFAGSLDEAYARSQFSYLGDVARLELAIEEALLAPESGTLDLKALAGVPPDRLGDVKFTPAPSFRLVGSAYPVLSIWRSHQPDGEERVDLARGAEHVAVRRVGDDVEMRLIGHAAFKLGRALNGGASLTQAWARLSDEVRENLSDALESLTLAGGVSHFSVPER